MEAPIRYIPFASRCSMTLSVPAVASRNRAGRATAERTTLSWVKDAIAVNYFTRAGAHERAGSVLRAPIVEQDVDADREDPEATRPTEGESSTDSSACSNDAAVNYQRRASAERALGAIHA